MIFFARSNGGPYSPSVIALWVRSPPIDTSKQMFVQVSATSTKGTTPKPVSIGNDYSGGYVIVKFTTKYIIVGDEGAPFFFRELGLHSKFQNQRTTPSEKNVTQ